MSHPLETATKKVHVMKRTSNLLAEVDFHHPDQLPLMAAGEVLELSEAVNKYEASQATIEQVHDELNDIWVLIASYFLANGDVPDFGRVTPSLVNFDGFGRKSFAFEKFHEMVSFLKDNPEDIYHVMAHLISIAKHLPVPNIMFEGFLDTIDKVLANRPPALYSTWDPFFKRILNPEEALLKYSHLERMTKMLRAAVGRKLQPTDWQPYSLLMLNWQSAEQNQLLFNQMLSGEQNGHELHHQISELQGRAYAN